MSEIVILYILCRYDASIYKISKIMQEMFFAFLKPSLGTINPAVKKLIKAGCIDVQDKMSQGGMASKMCSITPVGRKHLKNLLLSLDLEVNHPAHILNNARIALFCADILEEKEKAELIKNIKNHLILYKGRTLEALNSPYLILSDEQKKISLTKVDETEKILEML